MNGLSGFHDRARKLEHALPTPIDSDDPKALLGWVPDQDLDNLNALLTIVERRAGLKYGAPITENLLTKDEKTKVDDIFVEAKQRKESGQPPYGPKSMVRTNK
jgi:hypothetical protein